jgi:hypothetical protein
MKEPYGEGLASHTGSESCAHSRKAGREALTGAHAGGVLSRDMLKKIRVPTSSMMAEGNTGGRVIASVLCTLRGQRPPHVWKLHARDPGGSINARQEVMSGPVGEGDEPQVQHER